MRSLAHWVRGASLVLLLGHGGHPSAAVAQQRTAVQRPIEVLLVGTFHFAQVDTLQYDVLAPVRRAEAERVVDALVAWRPDRIFLESQPEFNQSRIDSLMRTLSATTDEPRRNEVYRLGMRTALRLGQERVYLVDHPGRYGGLYGEMEEVAGRLGKLAVLDGSAPYTTRALHEVQSSDSVRLATTLPAFLQYLNSPEYRRRDQAVYVSRFPRIGYVPVTLDDTTAAPRAGAELVADWYRRNVMIFSKVLNWMSWDERRIVIVIGAGHVPILRHLFESHGGFRVVEVADVLPRR